MLISSINDWYHIKQRGDTKRDTAFCEGESQFTSRMGDGDGDWDSLHLIGEPAISVNYPFEAFLRLPVEKKSQTS
jgi:hypothetical protein